jgi:hypothetical protein
MFFRTKTEYKILTHVKRILWKKHSVKNSVWLHVNLTNNFFQIVISLVYKIDWAEKSSFKNNC